MATGPAERDLIVNGVADVSPVNDYLNWTKLTSGYKIESRALSAAPAGLGTSDAWKLWYVSGTPAGGDDWEGKGGEFAAWTGTAWIFSGPIWDGAGPLWDLNTTEYVFWNGSAWRAITNGAAT